MRPPVSICINSNDGSAFENKIPKSKNIRDFCFRTSERVNLVNSG